MQLPQFVRRLPYVIYALAFLLGGWRFWNEFSVAEATFVYAGGMSDELWHMRFMSRSSALYWGVVEAAYMISSGAIVHVLIAIYDKIGGNGE